MNERKCDSEHEFALIVGGVPELDSGVEDALFEAGCDDATLSMRYGLLYIEFSRLSPSLKDAILSAIHDIRKANIGAEVLRVDECDLVTPSEIARRINRSRQLVFQYINGGRGPGGFPAPECHIVDGKPLWRWCAVSYWLAENNIIRPEASWNAQIVATINTSLEVARQRAQNPALVNEVNNAVEVGI